MNEKFSWIIKIKNSEKKYKCIYRKNSPLNVLELIQEKIKKLFINIIFFEWIKYIINYIIIKYIKYYKKIF